MSQPRPPRPPRRPPQRPAGSHGIAAALDGIMAADDARRTAPASDAQLATVWQLWNALPADFDAEDRRTILTKSFGRGHTDYARAYAALRRQFRRLLPLGSEYHQALDAAAFWESFTRGVNITFGEHLPLMSDQLRYRQFDNVLTGCVALYRTARELDHTRHGLRSSTAPLIAEIEHVRARYSAYLQARQDTVDLLAPFVFLPSLESPSDLLPSARAGGLPNPPRRFPGHLYFARLAHFGKCSPDRLASFMARDFFLLTHGQRLEFCREFHQPKAVRNAYSYPYLYPWLADNAPVFNIFGARWLDIFAAVQARFNHAAPPDCRSHPRDATSLKILWRDFEQRIWPGQSRRLAPPAGAPRKAFRCLIPPDLLTPLPFVTAK